MLGYAVLMLGVTVMLLIGQPSKVSAVELTYASARGRPASHPNTDASYSSGSFFGLRG